MRKDINESILFIGMGRSGSSIIYEAFAQHNNLAFFSQYCSKFPKMPILTFIHRFVKTYREKEQWEKQGFLKKLSPNPKEPYNIWELLCGDKFRYTFLKDQIANDEEKRKVINYINKILFYQGKERFVAKITGPPRIKYLSSIFKNAYYIDIIRDPRAIVSSLLKIDFRKQKGLTNPNWVDSLTEDDKKEWASYKNSAVALAALEWRSVYRQTLKEKDEANINYAVIKFEDFVENPTKSMMELIDFAKLENSDNVIYYINKTEYKNTNYKYKEFLSNEEVDSIIRICQKEMRELGYL